MHADSFCILRPACGWQSTVAVVVEWYTAGYTESKKKKNQKAEQALLDLDKVASSVVETPCLAHSGWL